MFFVNNAVVVHRGGVKLFHNRSNESSRDFMANFGALQSGGSLKRVAEERANQSQFRVTTRITKHLIRYAFL